MTLRIQLRGGTAQQWTDANPTLADREPGYEGDTGKLKIGDGITAWNTLAYFVPGSSGGGSTAYVHTQASASTLWTINHNLGVRPSVTLFDGGGSQFDGDVSHPTVNQTLVALSVATAGFARLI